jgi:hypothetical protein
MKTEIQGRKFKSGVYARLNGMMFGNLTVLHRAGHRGKFAAWMCRCTCGVEKVVGGQHLRRGKIRSCNTNGHRWKTPRPPAFYTEYKSEYQSWTSMRERCNNPNHKKYNIYGGRGITVCERWADFQKFMLDMGRKLDPKFTIERKDVNGNYQPTNCCWIARKDQGRNKRNSVFVTYNGKRMLLIDLVEELGLSRMAVYGRLKMGWTLAQAIALPLKTTKPRGTHKKKRTPKKVLQIATFDDSALHATPREKRK